MRCPDSTRALLDFGVVRRLAGSGDACVAGTRRVRCSILAKSAGEWSLQVTSRVSNWSMQSSRRTPRLPGFDYATPGVYFVSTCTHRRRCVLGSVVDGKVCLVRGWKDRRRGVAAYRRETAIRDIGRLCHHAKSRPWSHCLTRTLERRAGRAGSIPCRPS